MLLLFSIFIGQQVEAQNGFGLRVGLVSSDTKADLVDLLDINLKAKTGFDIALLYNYETGSGVSIQPEVHYTQLGFKVDVGFIKPKGDINYIRIPVLIKYDVMSNNDNLSLSPFVAPYLGILASDDIDLLSLFTDDLPITSTDVGLDVGVNFKLSNGLFFDARYTLGFQNILDLPVGELKNSAIGVGIGYIFSSNNG